MIALLLVGLLQAGVVESVIVHGNHTTPTADVLSLAGDLTGQPATDALLAAAAERLRASRRFAGVEVRRRLLSLDDESRVLVVVVVDEHEAVAEDDLTPGAWRRFRASGMWLPILDYQEGYGFTYGARVSLVDRFGPRSRISVPLSWGGTRQAAIEVERSSPDHPLSRVAGGAGISRRENPFYELADTRRTVWGRLETTGGGIGGRWLTAGGELRRSRVNFAGTDSTLVTARADVTVDTRQDPALPRNAVLLSAALERLGFDALALPGGGAGGRAARRVSLDARGYLGLTGQLVLGVGGRLVTASAPLPGFEQQLLGGAASLRGSDVGSAAGDNLAAASLELVAPITSPLSVARTGVRVFADRATVYAAGSRLRDQRLAWGGGAGWFLHAAVFRLTVDVGWREGRGRPNAHVRLSVP